MAHMNLSNIFLDPDIGTAFTQTKKEIREDYLERSGYWGDSRIRTIDDLRLELDNEAAAIENDIEVRDDFSNSDDDIADQVFQQKGKDDAIDGVSAAEMKEIIE